MRYRCGGLCLSKEGSGCRLESHQEEAAPQLWPPPEYEQQLQRLRKAIGQQVYLAELNNTEMTTGVKFSSCAYRLLALVDFPEPDPYRQLSPHMIILDDGRGINLGRLARISRNRAFDPAAEDILYQNHEFIDGVLLAPRQLSRASLSCTSRQLFAQMLGEHPGLLLETTKRLPE